MNDENVLSVFYGGSIGNQNTDLYSDIDLRIVVNDKVFENYRQRKKQRAEKWGRVLFFEDNPEARHTVAHYETFVKVDVFYYKAEEIHSSVWLKNIKIVQDIHGFMENVSKKSMKLSYVPTLQEVENWRNKFFAYAHETYRRAMRSEFYYALRCLDNLRFCVVTAWYMENGIQPNSLGDWGKVEGERSKLKDWQLSLLAQWDSNRDSIEIMKTIKQIIPQFKKVHHRLCKRVGATEDSEWVDEILELCNFC
ncbi:aminoglycoside 6-adenylyltransferase [Virgibacillus ihumii]|uniref:aminoglycoside 6-adenylyltransferase n=1 Tax=Virgibacillus ihumii TaxID=2686091 RepID=UPI0031B5DA96